MEKAFAKKIAEKAWDDNMETLLELLPPEVRVLLPVAKACYCEGYADGAVDAVDCSREAIDIMLDEIAKEKPTV